MMLSQELSRMALRQKQQREQECARINSMKIHNQWRKIMRVAKVEELRGEVEILSQSHEREVDRKDALVQVGASQQHIRHTTRDTTAEDGCHLAAQQAQMPAAAGRGEVAAHSVSNGCSSDGSSWLKTVGTKTASCCQHNVAYSAWATVATTAEHNTLLVYMTHSGLR
jgi:hypothetical protein